MGKLHVRCKDYSA